MHDLDMLLGKLRDSPVPPGLPALDAAVMAALANRSHPGQAARPLGLAAFAALAIGMLGALPGARVEAVPTAAPLGVAVALAPSTLLGG